MCALYRTFVLYAQYLGQDETIRKIFSIEILRYKFLVWSVFFYQTHSFWKFSFMEISLICYVQIDWTMTMKSIHFSSYNEWNERECMRNKRRWHLFKTLQIRAVGIPVSSRLFLPIIKMSFEAYADGYWTHWGTWRQGRRWKIYSQIS